MRQMFFCTIFYSLIFAQICGEWEIPDQLRPPQIFTTIQNGFQSAIYFTENDEDTQQWFSQILLEFAERQNKVPMMTMATKEKSESDRNTVEHTVARGNWRTIIDAIGAKNGTFDGCKVLMNESERMDFEIGTANITIGCPNIFNLSSFSSLNVYFCKNGTECQRAKTKWSNCAITVFPDGNWTYYGTENSWDGAQLFCNKSLAPILLHLRPFEEKMPDLRPSYDQRRGRFHCPSEVTCLYEMLFDGQNVMEVTNLAINFTIFLFLFFLNGCKIKLGH